jgi:hypothetical protein
MKVRYGQKVTQMERVQPCIQPTNQLILSNNEKFPTFVKIYCIDSAVIIS